MCAVGVGTGYLVARPREPLREPAGRSTIEDVATKARPTAADAPLVTRGITVQVLDAAGSDEAAARVARRLRRLGFDVVVVHDASVLYDRTTVFWSAPRFRTAAARLAARFGWRSHAQPDNLSRSVSLHVVVGRDEARAHAQ